MVTPDGCAGPVWVGSTPDGATLAFDISHAPDRAERAAGSPEAADAVITDGRDGHLTLTTVAGGDELTFVADGLARPDLRAVADTARRQLATTGLDLDALPLPDGFRLLPAPREQSLSPLPRTTVRMTDPATGQDLVYRYAAAGSPLRGSILDATRAWVADGAVHALVPAPAGYTDPALLVLRDDHEIVLLDPAGDASTLDEDQLVGVADTLRPPDGARVAG